MFISIIWGIFPILYIWSTHNTKHSLINSYLNCFNRFLTDVSFLTVFLFHVDFKITCWKIKAKIKQTWIMFSVPSNFLNYDIQISSSAELFPIFCTCHEYPYLHKFISALHLYPPWNWQGSGYTFSVSHTLLILPYFWLLILFCPLDCRQLRKVLFGLPWWLRG